MKIVIDLGSMPRPLAMPILIFVRNKIDNSKHKILVNRIELED